MERLQEFTRNIKTLSGSRLWLPIKQFLQFLFHPLWLKKKVSRFRKLMSLKIWTVCSKTGPFWSRSITCSKFEHVISSDRCILRWQSGLALQNLFRCFLDLLFKKKLKRKKIRQDCLPSLFLNDAIGYLAGKYVSILCSCSLLWPYESVYLAKSWSLQITG